jgi:hypothetical protein
LSFPCAGARDRRAQSSPPAARRRRPEPARPMQAQPDGRMRVAWARAAAPKAKDAAAEKPAKKRAGKRKTRDRSSSSSQSPPPPRKRKKEKQKTAVSSSSASSSSTSSDSDKGSTGSSSSSSSPAAKKKGKSRKADKEAKWSLLNDIWPLETRPGRLQDKAYVNRQSWRTLHALQDRYEREAEKKGFGSAIFGKDQKLKKTRFSSKSDDGFTKLHKARWLRLPLAPPDKYWKDVPRAHEQRFRHVQLAHYGAESQVNEKVVLSLHDRQVMDFT